MRCVIVPLKQYDDDDDDDDDRTDMFNRLNDSAACDRVQC